MEWPTTACKSHETLLSYFVSVGSLGITDKAYLCRCLLLLSLDRSRALSRTTTSYDHRSAPLRHLGSRSPRGLRYRGGSWLLCCNRVVKQQSNVQVNVIAAIFVSGGTLRPLALSHVGLSVQTVCTVTPLPRSSPVKLQNLGGVLSVSDNDELLH